MNPIIRNILAVLAGIIGGGFINMGIITMSGSIIPPPEGADLTTTEGLRASMHLFEFRHFMMPFLAHAIGTFAGAVIAAFLAVSHKMTYAMAVGGFFLLGGLVSVFMLPSPLWFAITDLLFAYIPMAYLGGKIAIRKKENSALTDHLVDHA